MNGIDDLMQLEVPPAAEFVGTARLFTAEASRHLGASEEVVADLKIAISEVCTGAIEAQRSGSGEHPVRVSIAFLDHSLQVEVFGAAGFETSGAPEPGDGLGLGLVQALFPQAEFSGGQGRGSTLRILVPVK